MEGILASLDGLSEEMQKEYKKSEEDGKFYLAVTTPAQSGWKFEDISKLKSSLGAARKEADDAKKLAKPFKDLDLAAAKDAMAKVDEMSSWTPEQKVTDKIDSVKRQMQDAHGKELKTLNEKLKNYETQFEELLITARATAAIAKKGAKVRGLMPHVKAATKMRISETGVPSVEITDEHGNPRVGDAAGNPMTMEQLIDEFEQDEELAGLFPGSGATGSGAGETPGGGTPPALGEIDKNLPPAEKLKAIRRRQAAEKGK